MIVIKNLCKSYGLLPVLIDLDLVVNDGETLVILGRSGVGKSVLLRQIIGIEEPSDSGTVEINGNDLAKMSGRERLEMTKRMGMLFQSAALFDSLSVGENVAFYLRQHANHLAEEEIQQRVNKALQMVDMEGTQNKMPANLSGGMRKRAALARLIVYRPPIILYDEPTTGLDPITAMQINELILNIQQELRGTSIIVTHDIQSALKVGDTLAFHDKQKIQYTASKEEFFNIDDPQLHAFLENAIVRESTGP